MIEQRNLKIIIVFLIALLFIAGIYIVGTQIIEMKEKVYNKGITQGKIDGRIEGWNSFLQDVCYDGLIVIGTDNETGRIIQKSLEDVCGR